MPGMRQTPLTSFSLPPRIRMDGGIPEGEGGGVAVVSKGAGEAKGPSTGHESRKGVPWTESEHMAFLMGLKKLGKGNWRGVSRYFVPSRTPTQVASHAQKHFLRLQGVSKRKSRFSMLEQVAYAPGVAPEASGAHAAVPRPGWGVYPPEAPTPGRTQYKTLAVKNPSPKGKQGGPYYGPPVGMPPYPHPPGAPPARLPIAPYPSRPFTKICRPMALHAPAGRSEELAAEVARHLKTQEPLQSSLGSAFEPAEKTPVPSPRASPPPAALARSPSAPVAGRSEATPEAGVGAAAKRVLSPVAVAVA